MNLTAEQLTALQKGEPVDLVVDDTSCVLVRTDIYEQVRVLISPEETYDAVEKVLDQEDDPALESYQIYK